MAFETAFTMDTSSIKYGPGVTREVGADLTGFGVTRAMVVTDPNLATSEPVAVTLAALKAEGIDAVLFDRVRVEPTDASFKEAIAFATEGGFDGFVAVGGGSVDRHRQGRQPLRHLPGRLPRLRQRRRSARGRPVPGRLKPLIAIPTTAGTGSETTGVAIFDLDEMHAKTGIAHRALRPALGIVDPDNTRTMPPMVAACSGARRAQPRDRVLHRAPVSTSRPAPERPRLRPAYQGANPISDIWASAGDGDAVAGTSCRAPSTTRATTTPAAR